MANPITEIVGEGIKKLFKGGAEETVEKGAREGAEASLEAGEKAIVKEGLEGATPNGHVPAGQIAHPADLAKSLGQTLPQVDAVSGGQIPDLSTLEVLPDPVAATTSPTRRSEIIGGPRGPFEAQRPIAANKPDGAPDAAPAPEAPKPAAEEETLEQFYARQEAEEAALAAKASEPIPEPAAAGPIEPPAPPKKTAAGAGEGPRVPDLPDPVKKLTPEDIDKLDLGQAQTREKYFNHEKNAASLEKDRFKSANPGYEADENAVAYVNRLEANEAANRANEVLASARASSLEKAAATAAPKPVAPKPAAAPAPAPAPAAPAQAAAPAPAPTAAAAPSKATGPVPTAAAATPAPAPTAQAAPAPAAPAPAAPAQSATPAPAATPTPKLSTMEKIGQWFKEASSTQRGRPGGPAVSEWQEGLVSTQTQIPNPANPKEMMDVKDGVVPQGIKVTPVKPGAQLGKYNVAGHDDKGIGHFKFLDVNKIGKIFENILEKSNLGKPSEYVDGGFVLDPGAKSTSLVSAFLNAAKQAHGPRRFANLGGGEINTGFVGAAADEMQRSVDKFITQFCERQYNKCIEVGDVEGAKNAKKLLEKYIIDSTETRWKSLGFKDAVSESTLNKVKPSLLAEAEKAAAQSLKGVNGSSDPKIMWQKSMGQIENFKGVVTETVSQLPGATAIFFVGDVAAKAPKIAFPVLMLGEKGFFKNALGVLGLGAMAGGGILAEKAETVENHKEGLTRDEFSFNEAAEKGVPFYANGSILRHPIDNLVTPLWNDSTFGLAVNGAKTLMNGESKEESAAPKGKIDWTSSLKPAPKETETTNTSATKTDGSTVPAPQVDWSSSIKSKGANPPDKGTPQNGR